MLVLPAGVYRIEATGAGFQSVINASVTVDALATVPLDFKLSVGTSTSEITVSASERTKAFRQTNEPSVHNAERNYAALPLQMARVSRAILPHS